ncbi:MAG: polyprenyl synthetase family protein [Alphaproteobacteria bacterium]
MPVALTATADAGPRRPSAYDVLRSLCADDLNKVNQLILEHMDSEVVLIPQVAGHIIAAGGKRLRPLLTLASARMCGHRGDRHIALAATVEFIHTATLLHDDVVDESDLRRGRDTANTVWGNKPSVLVGDFLFSRAFQLMVKCRSLEILDILSTASVIIAEGEVAQLVTANDTSTTTDDYLAVIRAKTAALFDAACRIGAVVAERPLSEADALSAFGLNLGIAFQLIDDYLDYSAQESQLGKSVGDDFREGKITLPIVLAFARGDDDDRRFWCRVLEDLDQKPEDFNHALTRLRQTGALADTMEQAREYADAAREALALFPDNTYRRALADIADFCVERAY